MRRRVLLGAAAMVAIAGAGAAGPIVDAAGGPATVSAAEADAENTRSFATVERGDLTAEREFRATVSFGDTWTMTTDLAGTITQRHERGEVVEFGETLIRIDDRPLFLGQGSMPMYRELHKVDTRGRDENGDRQQLQQGFDVAQLQFFLIQAGHDAGGDMTVDGTFGASTEKAIKAWQTDVGISPTGRVDSSQLVFTTDPVRIATTTRVGDRFEALQVANASSAVLVDTSNRDRSAFTVGATVEVAIPNEPIREGVVEEQEQVVGDDGSTVWRTTITTGDDLPGDAATAEVTARSAVATDVKIVPVGALLALAEGGFAVEVETAGGTTLVAVQVGDVLEGMAEIDGAIAAGDRVVVVQ